jgi:regulator of cell morphogenesis and NO signaling
MTLDHSAEEDLRQMSTPELLAHLVSQPPDSLRTALAFLGHLVAKVARVHGAHNPKLLELEPVFVGLRELLDQHMDGEEKLLFRLVSTPAPDLADSAAALAAAHREHIEMSSAVQRIRGLTDDFTAPEWACTSYDTLLSELRTLERDVVRHVHLQTHVLFPRLAAA